MIGRSNYMAAVGEQFSRADGTKLALHAVSDAVVQGSFTSWTLVFRGPADQPLEQGVHALTNDSLGEQSIFLVPIGPADGSLEYEAVFSHAGGSDT